MDKPRMVYRDMIVESVQARLLNMPRVAST
jgi:hypothetical protein